VTDDRRTPTEAWQSMLEGNRNFVGGTPEHPRQDVERRAQLLSQQSPTAALFGCSDSRLAAEIIFDQGIGDLFVVRNAGQVVSGSVLGSLEYAVGVLEVPLIVVLGHDACGAVAAAIESQEPDAPALPAHIARLIAKIVPAVQRVGRRTDPAGDGAGTGARAEAPSDDAAPGSAVAPSAGPIDPLEVGREHLRDTIAELLERSELISDRVADGSLAVVGANYRLGEGQVVPDVMLGLAHHPPTPAR
jgi:carbonic anhydrase